MSSNWREFERFPRFQAAWVRRPYFIEDGWVKPAAGSRVEHYDPFEGYYPREPGMDLQPMYVALWDLDACNDTALRDFASTWGLLGLFQHQLVSANCLVNCPDPEPVAQWAAEFESDETGAVDASLFASQPIIPLLAQCPPLYLELTTFAGVFTRYEPRAPQDWQDPACMALMGRRTLGTVTYCDLEGVFEQRPLDEYWARYFPQTPQKPRDFLPQANSPDLWEYLCEPQSEIEAAVAQFREVYSACVSCQHTIVPDAAWLVQRAIGRHLLGVRQIPRLVRQGGVVHWEVTWRFPSLLSAAYQMLLRDFTTPGRHLLFCRNGACGRPVITDRSDRFYCSRRCKNTDMTRRRRARLRGEGDPQ